MERQIMWSAETRPGLEHFHLFRRQERIIADSLVLGIEEQMPFRIHYEIHCDPLWRVRAVHLELLAGSSQSLHLLADGEGAWTTEQGEALPEFAGCLDVDITATPFTNTLPISRLSLQPGASATIHVVYIDTTDIAAAQVRIRRTMQRYTCLESTAAGGRYLYESLKDGVSTFRAELPVDQDGLVLDYPVYWRRRGSV